MAPQQSKISSEVIKQQAIETVGKVGEKLEQVDLQKLKENTKQAKYIANGIKQVTEFLSNFSSKNDNNGGQAVQGITPKAEAKVYGYANIKNETLREKYPNFVIQNMDIKDYENAVTVYDANVTNISTNPQLLGLPTTIVVKSTNNNDVDVNVVITNKINVDNTVKFNLQNIAGNAIKDLTVEGVGLDAKSLTVSGHGTWQFNGIINIVFNIPLQLDFKNVSVSFNQFKQNISKLTLKGAISGDLNNISFAVDVSSLQNLLSVDTVKDAAGQIAKQTGLDKKAQQVINNTKINGKSIKDLNTNDLKNINKKDVQNIAYQFGIKLN